MALLLGWYGDDFSGSADVLEVLAQSGVRAALFPAPPSQELLAQHPQLQAVGIAGISRSLPTERMADELAPAFQALAQLRPRLVHYKICSTFDSSPTVGSIGQALDLGQSVFASPWVPLIVGAPALGRYCVFGNLFARSGLDSPVYRLDRHPTMTRHPVTPMTESDLRLHLAKQTLRPIGLVDLVELRGGAEAVGMALQRVRQAGAEVVLLDVLEERDLPVIGRLLWDEQAPWFVVGSSGVEYALTAHWRQSGQLPPAAPCPGFGPASPVLVVSGSCSPVTARQIDVAVANGFVGLALQPSEWDANSAGVGPTGQQALRWLEQGRHVLVHAARGSDDPRIAEVRSRWAGWGGEAEMNRTLGHALAQIIQLAVNQLGIQRVAVAGGDTSGYVARQLGLRLLEFVAPLAPGSPLCRAQLPGVGSGHLEITFKGGQVGKPDFFVRVATGTQLF